MDAPQGEPLDQPKNDPLDSTDNISLDQPKGEPLFKPRRDKPALTLVIQSWWTPAVALIMLVVGLLGGYFGRPLMEKASTASEVALTTPVATTSAASPTLDPTIAAIDSKEKLMALLVANTTHFKGDPNAAVTMIEFSDYQ